MQQFAIIVNGKNPASLPLARRMTARLQQGGGSVLREGNQAGIRLKDIRKLDFSGCEAVITLGGDGTLLAAARHLAELDIPLFGVNMGRVGFLSSVEKKDALTACDSLLSGNFRYQQRMLLQAEHCRRGQVVATATALNDIVINNNVRTRAVTLELLINSERVDVYNGDGIIVSTPTGSTGYALSAGGPIVSQEMQLMLVIPICPHTFFSRPIIAPAEGQVLVVNRSGSQSVAVSADGQLRFHLEHDDQLIVTRAPRTVRLIQFNGKSYFQRIKSKLYV